MMNVVNISQSQILPLSFQTAKEFRDEENKGWSFSGVYSFEELRDIYILLADYTFVSVEHFTKNIVIPKTASVEHKWTPRRVREILNALVNFKWYSRNLNGTEYKIATSKPLFSPELLCKPISDIELPIFMNVFFSYSRFKEYISLYSYNIDQQNIIENSTPVYSFISDKKYTDSFFKELKHNPDILHVEKINETGEKNSGFSSFWDVFITWALKLNIMEKFNSQLFGMKLSNGHSFACSYFVSNNSLPSLPIIIDSSFPTSRIIDINNLIWHICTTYRKRLKDVKKYIINQYVENKMKYNLIRTSEIFINKSDKVGEEDIAYPLYRDSYVSHLIVR